MTFDPGQHVEVEHTYPAVIVRQDGEEFYVVTAVLPEHMLNATGARHPEFADTPTSGTGPGAAQREVAFAAWKDAYYRAGGTFRYQREERAAHVAFDAVLANPAADPDDDGGTNG